MEFILISDTKIKVMLTEEDLQEFEIDADELDYSNTETKRMFWDILGRAKHITGFDTEGQKVMVQLYPSRRGGCELFVTKIGTPCHSCDGELEDRESSIVAEKIMVNRGQSPSPKIRRRASVFSFDQLEDMLCVCRTLNASGYSEESSAYISDNGEYYLSLIGIDTTGYNTPDRFSFIYEFGNLENHKTSEYFLGERGRMLCAEGAVEKLSRC